MRQNRFDRAGQPPHPLVLWWTPKLELATLSLHDVFKCQEVTGFLWGLSALVSPVADWPADDYHMA